MAFECYKVQRFAFDSNPFHLRLPKVEGSQNRARWAYRQYPFGRAKAFSRFSVLMVLPHVFFWKIDTAADARCNYFFSGLERSGRRRV